MLLFYLLTETWSKYVRDSLGGIGQKDGPVEAEDNDYKENRYDDFVDRLDGSHTSADRETSRKDGHPMAQDRPVVRRLKNKGP